MEATQLVAAFWPGPLTLIVKRAAHIPDAVSGGQDTVGLRWEAELEPGMYLLTKPFSMDDLAGRIKSVIKD